VKPRAIVAAGLVAIVVALAVVAIVNARQGPEQFEPGTPEATVQEYFQDLIEGQADEALDLIDPDLGCDSRYTPTVGVSRVVLDRVTYNTDRTEASARVQVTETWGTGLFGPDEATFVETIHLTADADGDWYISRPPWPYFDCRPGG